MAQVATISRPNQTTRLTHSNAPSKAAAIKIALGKMAIRRQAQIGEAEFAVYSEDLMSYELDDIAGVLDELGKSVREEGETAFPSIGTILKKVRRIVAMRKQDEQRRKEKDEQESWRRVWEAERAESRMNNPETK